VPGSYRTLRQKGSESDSSLKGRGYRGSGSLKRRTKRGNSSSSTTGS